MNRTEKNAVVTVRVGRLMKKVLLCFLFAAGFFSAYDRAADLPHVYASEEATALPFYSAASPGKSVPGILFDNSIPLPSAPENYFSASKGNNSVPENVFMPDDDVSTPENNVFVNADGISGADVPPENMPDVPGDMSNGFGDMADVPGDVPDSPENAPENSENMPENSGDMSENSGNAPENSGDMPEDSENTVEGAGNVPVPVHFERVNIYWMNLFTDVPANSWCADHVRIAYEYGIMTGKTDRYFDTAGSLTLGQGIAMACRIHGCFDGETLQLGASNPWYQAYVDYAFSEGILNPGAEILSYANACNRPISRGEFAVLLSQAVPDGTLPHINDIPDGAIPDLPEDSPGHDAVYRFYRAGILTGSDERGTFAPQSNISRGAAAAVVSRIAEPELRQSVTITPETFPSEIK